jgi:hypothetical protein
VAASPESPPAAAVAAFAYRGLGWAVIPVHTPGARGCSCGRAGCPSPGKHPRVRWQTYAERGPGIEEIRGWWRRWPDANVGVLTGRVSGVAVLDVDPRRGGDAALAGFEARWGPLPATTETLTGGGGRHLWLDAAGTGLPSAMLAPGLELKADGGAVVTPPSLHESGRRYAWREGRAPWERAPAPVPGWLASLAGGTDGADGSRHPLGEMPARAAAEQEEFAGAWGRAGIELRPGDRYYLCPFHEDHRPSLHIDAEGCRWFCFGCRRGGGIGALRRLLGDAGPYAARHRLVGHLRAQGSVTLPGAQKVDVVGESHHQDELLALTGGARRYGGVDVEAVATLVPEPGNRFDPDAVAAAIDGVPVGYLRHRDAVRLRPLIDEALRRYGTASCRAAIRGGWDRGRGDVGAFGVVLLLPRAPDERDSPDRA